MTNIQKDFILLVKSAITGEKYELSEDFRLKSLISIAKNQGLLAVLYYGALNCGIDTISKEMQELFISCCGYISRNEAQNYEIKRLCKAFEDNGIDYMPLKGMGIRKLYPKTEMRLMSDADILIKMEQYEKIESIMQSLGFTGGEFTDHEIKWYKTALYVELHKILIPTHNKDYYSYFGDGWSLPLLNDGNEHRFKMSAEDEFIYIFTHFAKHYREAGANVRYVLDLWIYLKANLSMDEAYVLSQLEKLTLVKFYKNIIKTIDVWFNDAVSDCVTDLITKALFEGQNSDRATVSYALQNTKDQKKKGDLRFKKIFKPYSVLRKRYKLLDKVSILLPAFWIVDIFSIIRKKGMGNAVSDFKNMSSNKIDEFHKSLNYVGLDFNFKE